MIFFSPQSSRFAGRVTKVLQMKGEENGREWKLACFVVNSTMMPWPHQCNKELRESVGEVHCQLRECKKRGELLSALEIVESPSEGELKGKQLCGLSVWKCIEVCCEWKAWRSLQEEGGVVFERREELRSLVGEERRESQSGEWNEEVGEAEAEGSHFFRLQI